MMIFEFIFIKRKWAFDRYIMSRLLTRAKKDPLPLLLLIFPEGTVITPDTQAKSMDYAKKMDLKENFKHVLIPKTTGLQYCLEVLRPEVKRLLDITVGYEGLQDHHCPYDEYPLSKVFFEGKGPKEIHLHLRSYNVDDIPGLAQPGCHSDNMEIAIEKERADIFAKWMRERFSEKDTLSKQFYKTRHFDNQSPRRVIEIVPTVMDWLRLIMLWITGLFVMVLTIMIMKFIWHGIMNGMSQ